MRLPPKANKEWYEEAFDATGIQAKFLDSCKAQSRKIAANRKRYEAVEKETGVPWWWIGCTHSLEASCNFAGVLHNGERIIGTGKKTTLVPKGRGPFSSWEDAAIDALKLKNYHKETDWSIGASLMRAERYNGLGYLNNHPETPSPYLWARTTLSTGKGKYVADGRYDKNAPNDGQVGFVALMKLLPIEGMKTETPKEEEKMEMILRTVPKYGDHGTGDVRMLQLALNDKGFDAGPADDWFGDKTLKALQKFQKSKGMPGSGVIPADGGKTFQYLGLTFSPKQEEEIKQKPISTDNFFGAPWIGVNIDLLGRAETDAELNSRYVPEWKVCGLPGYKTLVGNTHAWCSIFVNHNLRAVGVPGTNSAGAASWSKWGMKCDYVFGCVLDIRHKSGGRHVGFFLYWIDEKKKIAAVLGGNQSNRFSIVANNLSGSGDALVSGPRWAKDVAAGQALSAAQVLAKYPILKVGGSAGSTR